MERRRRDRDAGLCGALNGPLKHFFSLLSASFGYIIKLLTFIWGLGVSPGDGLVAALRASSSRRRPQRGAARRCRQLLRLLDPRHCAQARVTVGGVAWPDLVAARLWQGRNWKRHWRELFGITTAGHGDTRQPAPRKCTVFHVSFVVVWTWSWRRHTGRRAAAERPRWHL